MVNCVQTRERGPSSAPVEIQYYKTLDDHQYNLPSFDITVLRQYMDYLKISAEFSIFHAILTSKLHIDHQDSDALPILLDPHQTIRFHAPLPKLWPGPEAANV